MTRDRLGVTARPRRGAWRLWVAGPGTRSIGGAPCQRGARCRGRDDGMLPGFCLHRDTSVPAEPYYDPVRCAVDSANNADRSQAKRLLLLSTSTESERYAYSSSIEKQNRKKSERPPQKSELRPARGRFSPGRPLRSRRGPLRRRPKVRPRSRAAASTGREGEAPQRRARYRRASGFRLSTPDRRARRRAGRRPPR